MSSAADSTIPVMPLSDQSRLTGQYPTGGAARRRLGRTDRGSPRLLRFAEITTSLAKRGRQIADRDPELASFLRIEERQLEAARLN